MAYTGAVRVAAAGVSGEYDVGRCSERTALRIG
jgi:hypothetical protein